MPEKDPQNPSPNRPQPPIHGDGSGCAVFGDGSGAAAHNPELGGLGMRTGRYAENTTRAWQNCRFSSLLPHPPPKKHNRDPGDPSNEKTPPTKTRTSPSHLLALDLEGSVCYLTPFGQFWHAGLSQDCGKKETGSRNLVQCRCCPDRSRAQLPLDGPF